MMFCPEFPEIKQFNAIIKLFDDPSPFSDEIALTVSGQGEEEFIINILNFETYEI